MKIINRTQFLAMPVGTLFSKYQPCYSDAFEIKGKTIGNNDYYAQGIANSVKSAANEQDDKILEDALQSGTSFELDLCCQYRDGMFNLEQLFVVWEYGDVLDLIRRLTEALQGLE